jgi:hypothetical protein
MRSHRARVVGLFCFAAAVLAAADPAWRIKRPSEWAVEDARQLLTSSPWAREIAAGVARRQSEDELRDGGQMGQPRGLGYDGVDPKGSGVKMPTDLAAIFTGTDSHSARSSIQSMKVRLRWESALPIRLAELKAGEMGLPTSEGEGYRIAVYKIPGSNLSGDPKKLAKPLKDGAVLKREGKPDVKPSLVEAFAETDGWAIVYLFPAAAEISLKDKEVTFDAHIGRIVIVQPFDLTQMTFQGKLEI